MTAPIPLQIVKPLTITDAILVTTDVIEADYAAWDSATTYGLTARVIVASEHKIYESLQATNLNHPPATSPTYWVEVSATNRWKLFDTSNSTQTVKAASMSYTLRPDSPITALALTNMTGIRTVRIRVDHPTYGSQYDQTTDLSRIPAAVGWWEWFFGVRSAEVLQFVALDLPGILGVDIIVDLTGDDSLAVGVLLIGSAISAGSGIYYGAKTGIQDYSRKETNDFGDTVLTRRAYARRATFDFLVAKNEADALEAMLIELRATPCLWVGATDRAATIIFGYYKQFDVVIAYPTYSTCQLEIEGLT